MATTPINPQQIAYARIALRPACVVHLGERRATARPPPNANLQRFSPIATSQCLKDQSVDVLAHELDGTIGPGHIGAAGVIAANREKVSAGFALFGHRRK